MTITGFDRDRAMAEALLEQYGQQEDDTPIAWFGMDDNEVAKAWKDLDERQIETMLERLQELDEDKAHRLLVMFGKKYGYLPGPMSGLPFVSAEEMAYRRWRASLSPWPQIWLGRVLFPVLLIFLGWMLIAVAMRGG